MCIAYSWDPEYISHFYLNMRIISEIVGYSNQARVNHFIFHNYHVRVGWNLWDKMCVEF